MAKRIIGLVLALCLIVGLLPMIALAEEATTPTATLKVNTGTKEVPVLWNPELTAGMAPAYAKVTAAGTTTTEGASETDWNLKAEWPTNGKPTLTLKNANLVNDTLTKNFHTIHITGSEDFVIELRGTNVLNTSLSSATTTASHTGRGWGILAENYGTLTICGESKNDSLRLDQMGAHLIVKRYNALTIENVDLSLKMYNTASNYQHGIIVSSTQAQYNDLTNLTIRNAKLDIDASIYHVNFAIAMTESGSPTSTNVNDKKFTTGDILIQNSEVRIYRGLPQDAPAKIDYKYALIQHGPNSTLTIDRSDVYMCFPDKVLNYAPTITNFASATLQDTQSDVPMDYSLQPGAEIAKAYALEVTHQCVAEGDDFDCTTPNNCVVCGKPTSATQTAHTPAADDGNCNTAVECANTGCNHICTEAKTHVNPGDDGDCTTAVKCSNTGCEYEYTPAAASHTAANRTDCNTPYNCDVCGKPLAVGEHTGGTATCTELAKCTVCQESYGKLADHTPAADDGDCTTAVKCSVCQGEAIAAKTHSFTNSADATCDNAGCQHTREVAPKPDFTFSYVTSGGHTPETKGEATLVMKAGDPTKYFTTGQYDTENPNNWYMKETTDSTNWNVKIEYAANGIPTVTLKGAKIANRSAMQFGGYDAAYEGPTKVIIEADSFVSNVMPYGGRYPQRSALNFNTKGQDDDVTITSVNNAKLTIATNCYDDTRGGISTTGNLILDNANIEIATSEYTSTSNGIAVIGGNLTVKGGSLKISGYDDPKTTHSPDATDHKRNVNAMYSALMVTKDAENTAKAGNITIEGGAKVSIAVSTKEGKTIDNAAMAIYNEGVFTIKDSDVEIGLVGKCDNGAQLFAVKPTLEYANNAYTVTATKSSKPKVNATVMEGADDSTYIVDMTPDASKIVDWAKTTELYSITYFQVTRGGNGGNGTGNGGSNPNTGDISILLTAAVALSSAVGFAGVTVLRKKEH